MSTTLLTAQNENRRNKMQLFRLLIGPGVQFPGDQIEASQFWGQYPDHLAGITQHRTMTIQHEYVDWDTPK
jgi:hypothetical protein